MRPPTVVSGCYKLRGKLITQGLIVLAYKNEKADKSKYIYCDRDE